MCRCPFPGINVLLFEGKKKVDVLVAIREEMARRNETGEKEKEERRGFIDKFGLRAVVTCIYVNTISPLDYITCIIYETQSRRITINETKEEDGKRVSATGTNVIFKLKKKRKETASDYNKLTNGVKTTTIIIIIYNEKKKEKIKNL